MKQTMKIITALGQHPDLVLEIIDFFNGGKNYTYNKEAQAIRDKFKEKKVSEVYLICTQDVSAALIKLKETLKTDYPDLDGHVHEEFLDCEDICCTMDDEIMLQKVYATVREHVDDNLVIASGGRKQVTQRLIEAGLLYGCMGYLTITAPRGKEKREESAHFNVLLTTARQFSKERRKRIIKNELGDNFRSLYLLPTLHIEQLQADAIGTDPSQAAVEITWLRKLPKADLHCHLGGSYDTILLKKMANALLDDFSVAPKLRKKIQAQMEKNCHKPLSSLTAADLLKLRPEIEEKPVQHPLLNLGCLFNGIEQEQYICTALLLDALSLDQIEKLSRNGKEKKDWPKDLTWYMACGDLGGSALLQTKNNLRLALLWLMEQAIEENVCYMEVRFSPDNYTKAGLSIHQVIETLMDEANLFVNSQPEFQVHFLIMATRHKDRAAMKAHIDAAVSLGKPGCGDGPRITGFDLAGQEEDNDPVKFKEMFMPLNHHFMNITIHAGEMEQDDKIWQALYDLHAKRVGHGLKLINNQKMMNYVRDYGIAIEMCPSSNVQTNGFRRFDQQF